MSWFKKAFGGGVTADLGQAAAGPGAVNTTYDPLVDVLTGGAVSEGKATGAANAANIAEAQKNREFQERMSNTAYQRAMEDMGKAGLNPMLAFSQGGASVPSGSTAQVAPERRANLSDVARTGKQLMETVAGLKQIGASTDQSKTQAKLNDMNTNLAEENTFKTAATSENIKANTELVKIQQKKERANVRKAEREAEMADARKDVDRKLAPVDAIMDRVGQAGGILGSGFRDFVRGGRGRTNEGAYRRGRDDGYKQGVRVGSPVE